MNFTITNSSHNLFEIIIEYYLLNILNCLGILFNIICIIIFYKIIKGEQSNQGHLFKYLFMKSISDFLFCLVSVPIIFYYRKDSTINDSYIMQVWFLVCYYYLSSILSQMSIWFEIFALIDCLCLLSMKFQWHKSKLCFKIVSISLIIIFLIIYSVDFFVFKIERKPNGGYQFSKKSFEETKFVHFFAFFITTIRDVLPIGISFILNGFILLHIKQSTNNRRRMAYMNKTSVTTQANELIAKSLQAEQNKTKMIIFTSCMHILHLPIVILNFKLFNIQSNFLLKQFCIVSFSSYYVFPIVSYILFNSTFRNNILKIILFIKFLFR
jgi:hypothetical protein